MSYKWSFRFYRYGPNLWRFLAGWAVLWLVFTLSSVGLSLSDNALLTDEAFEDFLLFSPLYAFILWAVLGVIFTLLRIVYYNIERGTNKSSILNITLGIAAVVSPSILVAILGFGFSLITLVVSGLFALVFTVGFYAVVDENKVPSGEYVLVTSINIEPEKITSPVDLAAYYSYSDRITDQEGNKISLEEALQILGARTYEEHTVERGWVFEETKFDLP